MPPVDFEDDPIEHLRVHHSVVVADGMPTAFLVDTHYEAHLEALDAGVAPHLLAVGMWEDLLVAIQEWTQKVHDYPDPHTAYLAAVTKAQHELDELGDAIDRGDLEDQKTELVDFIMSGIIAAQARGWPLLELMFTKLQENEGRRYVKQADGTYQHVAP